MIELAGIVPDEVQSTAVETLVSCVTAKLLPEQPTALSIHFVSPVEVATLNETHLQHSGPTDVLSFPVAAIPGAVERQLGDIVICPEVAINRGEPMLFLVHHGLLHLLGYDHHTDPTAWTEVYQASKNCLGNVDLSALPNQVQTIGFEA